MQAVFSFCAMSLGHAGMTRARSGLGQCFSHRVLGNHFSGNDARRYRKNAPTEHHHDRSNEAAHISLRRDVTKARRGHCGYRPVNRSWYAGEPVFGTLDDVQQGPEYDHHRQNNGEEHTDFSAAVGHGQHQPLVFVHVA